MNFTKRLTILLAALALGACGDDDGVTDMGVPDSTADMTTDTDTPDTTPDGAVDMDDGMTSFLVRFENTGTAYAFPQSGIFNTPDGAEEPGPLTPGDSYTITFNAAPGMKLSFATMFVPSNDYFYAPDGAGITLFDEDGASLAEDATLNITSELMLWDAGTEIDQPVGEGADQVQRQDAPNTGADDPTATVRLVPGSVDVPDTDEVILAELDSEIVDGAHQFTLTISNVSTPATLTTIPPQAVPLSPGVYVVHTTDDPLFTEGEADRGEGLEGIAEDGLPGDLGTSLLPRTGVTVVSSPGAYAVTGSAGAFFVGGEADRGEGLEAIAEDGSPMELASTLDAAMAVNTPVDADGPGPLTPGNAYEFTVQAMPGDRVHFTTMFVPSNDWVFALGGGMGVELFDTSGEPISGDISSALSVWDVGTEVDQVIGFGLDQVQNQSAPDTGAADDDTTVRQVLPDEVTVDLSAITVTVTPL